MSSTSTKIENKVSPHSNSTVFATASVMGLAFGLALEKGQVYFPKAVRSQMLLQNFALLKMFLAATSTSLIAFGVIHAINKEQYTKAKSKYPFQGAVSVVVGSAILGAGMTLSGACPGTVMAQLGTGVPNSSVTVLGCFLGGIAYSALFPFIKDNFLRWKPLDPHRFSGPNTPLISFVLGAMMLVVVGLLEAYFSCREQIFKVHSGEFVATTGNLMQEQGWPSEVAGVLVGILELPSVLILGGAIGSASSYVQIVANSVCKIDAFEMEYMKYFQGDLSKIWQVVYMSFACVGAAISATASGTQGVQEGVGIPAALFGGFLIVFGSRMASGCTSGHGISGFGMLVTHSFLAVPAIFGSAICTACLLSAVGFL
eukprot:TRINITY_DN399_c0_g1_i1.p1 TRINITY_DN399_c0_g1~~TRINITY_DN399_c0_g1_i1.p1  ORF type:complete len:371 (-),score=105.16 TRINITY_DN399_c0_g1_i1:81-1193(-)